MGEKGVGKANAYLTDQLFSPVFMFRRDEIERPDGLVKTEAISLEKLFEEKASKRREIIIANSPIVAKAVADYVKYCNPSWTFTTDYTSEDPENAPGMEIFQAFSDIIGDYYGNWDYIFDSGSRSAITHGAWFYELVIDADGRTPSDWRTLDPLTARYRRNKREGTDAEYFELGQYEKGFIGQPNKWTSFADDPTVQYIPAQPNVTNPYGDQILDTAVVSASMKAVFFRNMNAYLENLAIPSMRAKIITEIFRENHAHLPQAEFDQAAQHLADNTVKEFKTNKGSKMIAHTDDIELEPLITASAGSNSAFRDVIDMMERDEIRAVQSQPILMGRNEAVSETHATLQLIDYGVGLKKHTTPRAHAITRTWNYILQLNGYPPLAKFEFGFVIAEEFRKKADTYKLVQEALNEKEEGIAKVLENLRVAVEMELLNQAEAQELFQEVLSRRADDELQSGF